MNTNGLEVLKKNSADLVVRLGELDRKVSGGGKVKPIRVNGVAPAVDRLARDIHRILVEVDILEGQILGGHGGAA
ncbi:hypothetical protein [Acidithiobacillus ferrooxidans]|uniref:Uncharacterized protein n=1 Tax=Acidithiobacillus ferrooxidans TaxID=920 RepID=A0A2W1K5M4_ACIFR|nr:hypothetical protein [Acidithiobacillus ferrooxidans]MBU2819456.1 hypothetical protein [Acidithiobacillus ferrooxidans]MCR1342802.1 hypothetical protein [Acidithiobacillus ferrooxidans]PZD81790.1 hypothetical protein DN052_01565 [Acidithiobacillus ferrooxidans]QLK41912.1 hypothetical protein FE661_06900 [Acidithiobacillus ferrooxidans]QZT53877.1 hypothetical protein K7B00_06895 [Acidithiobacillus ferrooxidans]